jgi:outer membrane protein OmpA-like peptidoglycan-associated protein
MRCAETFPEAAPMKLLPPLAAAAIACSLGVTAADAADRQHRRDGAYAQKHYRDGYRRDWHRGYRHSYPRLHLHWSAPYRPYRYYDPYWYYPAPVYAYPYPLYEPIVVERVYEEPPRYYEEPRLERPEPYRERPRAQAEPSRIAPKAAAIPEPRLERYTLSAKELFEFDKATLRKPQPKLDEIADVLRRHPQIGDVTVTGYTDRLGTDGYNQALSERRANAVKGYLVEKGVAANRLKAVGRGEANPVVRCDDAGKADLIKCLEPNRRVEVEGITVERRLPAAS